MLERGKYGVERIRRPNDDMSGGFRWVFLVVALVAAVSLGVTVVRRYRSAEPAEEPPKPPLVQRPVPPPCPAPARPETPPPAARAAEPKPPIGVRADDFARRPVKLRNLLMRLDEAFRQRDTELAISTIEQIRALPGAPAADLDDALARRLGTLNAKRLFELKSRLWVKEVTVRRGDSASRIAAENGATLASLMRLNGKAADRLRIGDKLLVMDHPRFSLVVHCRARTADLSLNGKFFRRYDLVGKVSGKQGSYELTLPVRAFWSSLGIQLKPADRAELEMLMPKGASVLVSEM